VNPLVVRLAPEIEGRVRLGVLVLEGVKVSPSDPALALEVEALGASFRSRFGGRASGEVPGAEAARALYKSLGLDPTKTRPSSEALLRRVLKGEPLHRINTLVDALNYSSLRQQLPYGLYDLDRIVPPIVLRFGSQEESYEGIRKGAVNVAGRPVLVDAAGSFGNPTSDSARTQITLETRNALVVLYAPSSRGPGEIEEALRETGTTLSRFCGGTVGEVLIVPG
jgi:DNA/RNA-binding domain of Phe-tRNA-synthetase-like protein